MVWQAEHFKPTSRATAKIACRGCGAKRAQPRAAKTGIRARSQDLLRGRAMMPWKARGRPNKDSFCLNGLGALKYPYGEPIPRIYLGAVESIPHPRGAAFQAADTLSSGSSRPEGRPRVNPHGQGHPQCAPYSGVRLPCWRQAVNLHPRTAFGANGRITNPFPIGWNVRR